MAALRPPHPMSLEPFAWWNAVYTIPLAFVLVFLTITSLMSLVGGAFDAADHNVEVDADTDVDLDAHVDVDSELDLDADGHISSVEHATGLAHGQPGADHGLFISALVALGVGRAPLVMLLQILLLMWGVIGFSLHQAAGVREPSALLWSLPTTFVLSVLLTRGIAQAFSRFYNPFETAAVKRHQIVGKTGTVVYPVDAEQGTVNVRDEFGTLHRVRARTQHGELDSGKQIIVIGYDPDQKLYQVDDASTFVDRA
jgi:membrane protein implicated in regulation of membrane protease activity